MTQEEWRPIPGFPRYEVSSWGRIRSSCWGRLHLLKLVMTGHKGQQYYAVSLCLGPLVKRMRVHTAVLRAFRGFALLGQEARHLDGNRLNNNIDNLVWGSPASNAADQRRHGTIRCGEQNHMHKLTEVVVIEMRAMRGAVSIADMARRAGVTESTMRYALSGRTWRHLNDPGKLPLEVA